MDRRPKDKERNIRTYRQALAIALLLVVAGLSASIASPGFTFGATATAESNKASSPAQDVRMSTAPVAGPIVGNELKHDVSPPLASIPPAAPRARLNREREILRRPPPGSERLRDVDLVVQKSFGALSMPSPITTFDGINFLTSGCDCAPPDTNGDVGPDHYVQTVNSAYQIFDKSGTPLAPASDINTLWAGFGTDCETRNDGDPIVQYDQLADRWLISQFTVEPPFTQCMAVSTTGDPTGSYNRYAFLLFESATRFGDYPKVGVWPDGYYMSVNEFNAAGTVWLGAGNYAFDRARMLQGLMATYVYFGLPATDWGGQQPSDFDGSNLPPAGAPNLFVEIDDAAWDPANIPTDQIQMWRFHADFATPANATFTALPVITPPNLAAFDGVLCNFGNCVPQPLITDKLDTLADRVMFRVAYRNLGAHESIVFNHTVDTGTNKAAIRWYELRGINGTPSIYQQGTYDPNADHRWMGSIAQDAQGNMALGYSVSSSSTFPSVRYTGRLAADTLGTMPQGEAVIQNGNGSQIDTYGRWGDYSSMSVDPVDDCTFWYTNEYYTVTAAYGWSTTVGSFKFPGCVAGSIATATPTQTSTQVPSPTATACPIQFQDVPSTYTFYPFVRCLACRNILGGYACGGAGEPCGASGNPYFRPGVQISRGQIAKIVSQSAGLSDPPGTRIFEDVPEAAPFFAFIQRLTNDGHMSGYPCGLTPSEPCGAGNRPYFRPASNATRGQLSKIVSNAAGITTPVAGQTYEDVPAASPFYLFIERLTDLNVMSGYRCGGPRESCGAGNKPYFRPNADMTRGQASKIVSNTFFPNCQTPARK